MKIKNVNTIIIVAVGLLMPLMVFSQSTNQNYVMTKVNTAAGTTLDKIQYYDGLGRPVETVHKQITPAGKDLVSRIGYDNYGREQIQWLPAPSTKSDGTYNGSTTGANFYSDTYPYSEIEYEPSPLNRIKNQYGPGVTWRSGSGHKVTIDYTANSTSTADLICIDYSAPSSTHEFKKNGNYPAGQLFVKKITDEDENISYEFTDKQGRLLLQRQKNGSDRYDTYYIYDDFGNLRLVFSPEATDRLASLANGTYSFYASNIWPVLSSSAYINFYEHRNRLYGRRVPGSESTDYAYDKADRLILELTPERDLIFYKYDQLGREILSGLYQFPANASPGDSMYRFQQYYKDYVLTESASTTGNANFHYTWNSFPSLSKSEVTRVNFYDNYTYAADNTGNFGSLAFVTKSGYDAQHSSTQGLLTGTWIKMLDGSGWIKTTYYYDAFGNLVQKRTTNSTNKNAYDYEYYAYNYNNQMTKKLIEHSAFGQAAITEEYAYNIDSKLRLTSVNHKLNGGTGVNIAEYQYNELGQVREKKTTAYTYHLRGWLTAQTGQRFTENLYYTSNPKSGGKIYFGGNVSAMTCKIEPSTGSIRGYSYQYNALGWLTDAIYGEGASLSSGNIRYDESFTYNKVGSLKTLKRYGLKDNNSFGLIDDLTVTESTGNFIRKISDAITTNQSASDVMEFKFNSAALNDNHYFYSSCGALTVDYHKRICMIKYNYLTLPKSVQFRRGDRIEYVYDAAGVKRQTTHKVTNRDMNYSYWSQSEPATSDFDASQTVTRNYLGNKIYVNNQLKYILTEEGYIEKATGSNTYTAHYYLNDRLGNRRVVFDASGTLKQVNNYYPSGTSIAERRTDQGVQPFKFGGKELDRSYGFDSYDFEARLYDPVLMQFWAPDPLAHKYPSTGTLVYCLNNPVRYTDPTGMSTHTDSLGNVVAVYNDNDLGVFRHNFWDASNYSKKNTSAGGERMGETEYWDEFDPIYADRNADGTQGCFTIQFGKSFDPIITRMHNVSKGMNLIEIALKSRGGRFFDIKGTYRNAGGLLNGKYVTSRSAGNFLAAYNASAGKLMGVGTSFETFQKLAGALHVEESRKNSLSVLEMMDIVAYGYQYGPAPTYGETPYQYRMSKKGWNYGKPKK